MFLFIIDELLSWELFCFKSGFFIGVGNNLMLWIMTLHVNEILANRFLNWCQLMFNWCVVWSIIVSILRSRWASTNLSLWCLVLFLIKGNTVYFLTVCSHRNRFSPSDWNLFYFDGLPTKCWWNKSWLFILILLFDKKIT